MTIATAPTTVSRLPARRNPVLSFLAAQPLGVIGLVIIFAMALSAALADFVAPYDPLSPDYGSMLAAPSVTHWFGTDQYGRDILSRVMYGARTALAIGFFSSALGCIIGALIGAVSGYAGGRIDMIIQRLIDIILAFPIIILAMVVVAIVGKRQVAGIDTNLILAIAIPIIPKLARVARASTLSIAAMPYIDAARANGFSHTRIVLRHILPNIMAPFIVMFTAYIAQAILLEASLSFLGVGVTEPTPAWGLMLGEGSADLYRRAPWVIIFPGLAISFAVFAFNLFGDSLRDWLDPKMKG